MKKKKTNNEKNVPDEGEETDCSDVYDEDNKDKKMTEDK